VKDKEFEEIMKDIARLVGVLKKTDGR